jgi:TPR repeat protein
MYYLINHSYGTGYGEAAKWFLKAAKKGSIESQYYLGKIYCADCYGIDRGVVEEFAPDVDVNYKVAAKWFKLAAERGHPDAQYRLAAMLFDGDEGIAKNDTEALKWLRKADAKNVIEAKILLGHMYYEGREVKQNYAKAADLYRDAIKQKLKCLTPFISYYDLQPYAEAQLRLGRMYYHGLGVKQDFIEAYIYYHAAFMAFNNRESLDRRLLKTSEIEIAKEEFAELEELNKESVKQGTIYCKPHGWSQSECLEISELSLKLANQGDDEQQCMLARKYHDLGQSMQQTIKSYAATAKSECFELSKLFQNLAKKGNEDAQCLVASKYYDPNQSIQQIIKWYATMAKSGYINAWINLKILAIIEKIPEAQFALAQLFLEGCPGVIKNESNSLKLFQMAAKQGYEPAKEILKARMKQ